MRTRGLCPSLATPLPTGDGLLVRLPPEHATLTLEALGALCTAAGHYGNGGIDLTGRGAVQIRGLRPDTVAAFARQVRALGWPPPPAIPVSCSPLATLERDGALELGEIIGPLRLALGDWPRANLPAKLCVVVDTGGSVHLDEVGADIRLRAGDRGAQVHIGVGGDGFTACELGTVGLRNAVPAALGLVTLLTARRKRASALVRAEGRAVFETALGPMLNPDADPPRRRGRAQPLRPHALLDGSWAIGVGPPFGHTEHQVLACLLRRAKQAGATGVRTGPRTLLFVGLGSRGAARLAEGAEQLGFLVAARDPRRQIVACSGAPCCSAAELATHPLAAALTEAAPVLLDGSVNIHLSGCPKRCAHQGGAGITVVGKPGRCEVVVGGTPDSTTLLVDPALLPRFFAQLAAHVAGARRPGETAMSALERVRAERELAGMADRIGYNG